MRHSPKQLIWMETGSEIQRNNPPKKAQTKTQTGSVEARRFQIDFKRQYLHPQACAHTSDGVPANTFILTEYSEKTVSCNNMVMQN